MEKHLPTQRGDRIVPNAQYNPAEPLPNYLRELYVNEVIKQGGNKKKAYEIVYCGGDKIPPGEAKLPYDYMKGKASKARYDYLVKEAVTAMGLDTDNLLLKSGKLLKVAVAKNDIPGFEKMVNTIMKIQGTDIKKVMTVSKSVKITEEDLSTIAGVFSQL